MKGFWGKLLVINLDDQKCHYETISDEVLKNSLGGKGLGIHLLMERNPVGVDPLSSDNIFVIATGPATTTNVWGRNRFAVFSKSPATGGYGESYCGGNLAPKIKGCGFDAVILKGKASALVYLVIDENGVQFKDARMLRGKMTDEAEDHILENSPKGAGSMVIGPAGENLVACSAIKVERWRSLGRGGMGAVLGAKNVKGISFSGTKKNEVHDSGLLKKLGKIILEKGQQSPVTEKYQTLGTPMQVEVLNTRKAFPTRYWHKGYFEKWKNISSIYMQENFEIKSVACPPCFLRCTKRSKLKKGRHAGLEIEGPEFETIYAIGGLNELDSLEEVAWLNDLCDKLGIDTMSAGNLAGFVTEASLAGKIDFKMGYNEPDTMAKLFKMIAKREGIGDILARGIKVAEKEFDMQGKAIHVKGLEPGGFEPRVLKGMGLSFATSPRGACHLRGTFYKAELSGQIDPGQIKGKAKLHIDYEDRATLFDCMILCRFYRDFILWDELRMLVEGTTGLKFTKEELEVVANKITNQTREYNVREGLGSETDTLPERFLKEATEEGATLSESDLKIMIGEYNQIRKNL
ncbi:MAG: aldehyde ferredoxin oxidoreductase family protein [Bacteriovoracaceae bacterium]|nr:aldehyde ferredoxin oxidoreductase family protein [Bacteriovoracaceae bacterium]